MTRINQLIEWGDCGSQYSLYMKHFVDDQGKKGLKMIFEDLTHDKVTEMVIPPHKFPEFLSVVSGGSSRYGNILG